MDVEELAPHIRPAGHFDPLTRFVEFAEPGISVGLPGAAEVLEMPARVLALAVGAVAVEHRRRGGGGKRPVVAGISPEPAGLRLAGPGRPHRHWPEVAPGAFWGERPGAQTPPRR